MIELDLAPKKLIFNAIRKLFSRSAVANEAYSRALSKETGVRNGKRWNCAICGGAFAKSSTQADHINPVVQLGVPELSMTYNEYVNKTFNCGVENIQILCKSCHQVKSTKENRIRNDMKKIREIHEQLPSWINLEEVAELFNSLPDELKKITGKRIGKLIRIAIRWYIRLNEKRK